MTTTREPVQVRRHRETNDSMWRTLAQRDACIAKLVRYEIKLDKLRKLLARQTKALSKAKAAPLPQGDPLPPEMVEAVKAAMDDDPIPSFLDRRNLMADPKTKDLNAERRIVDKEKREAKLTGATRKMPLTGKAALDHIRHG